MRVRTARHQGQGNGVCCDVRWALRRWADYYILRDGCLAASRRHYQL